MKLEYSLTSQDILTKSIKKLGIKTWSQLCNHVKGLPYGRNKNRFDFDLVITETKGSCSSKHALLKKVADINKIPNIKLILGIYKMDNINTPNIGFALSENNIDFLPEAHCYLKINNKRIDYTSKESNISLIENNILEEVEITPDQVVDFKVTYHKEYLNNWLKSNSINFDFNQLWLIREQCIENLTKKANQ